MNRTPSGDAAKPNTSAPAPKTTAATTGKAPRLVSMQPAQTGSVVALFDVEIPIGNELLTIRRCRLVEDKNGPWISGPVESWTDPTTSRRRFRELATLPATWRGAIVNLAVDAWTQYGKSGKLPQHETTKEARR